MGKVRIKTLGDEDKEKKQKQDVKARKDAKKLEEKAAASEKIVATENVEKQTQEPAASPESVSEPKKDLKEEAKEIADSAKASVESKEEPKKETAASVEPKKPKKDKFKKTEAPRSAKYLTVAKLVDKTKTYSIKDASELLPKLTMTKFDETVELHLNTTESGISGKLNLPHGTGKTVRIAVADPTGDAPGTEALLKKIESGAIEFDILLATPEAMAKLARVARILGPRGLMPNPKNGTVTKNPKDAAKQYESGQVNFKTEAKFPLLHLTIGKVSFGPKKLEENIKAALTTVSVKKIKDATLKSTMSPAIKLQISSL